nr:MAG TPA: hypothetical protein [Siphoviridae sp. ct4aE30]
MGKEHELSMLIDELKKCGETLVGISGELAVFFSGADAEKPPVKRAAAKKKAVGEPKAGVQKETELTLEDVRAVCADKARKGYTAQVKAIINQHGVGRLSDVNPVEYETLLAEVEVLGNAG